MIARGARHSADVRWIPIVVVALAGCGLFPDVGELGGTGVDASADAAPQTATIRCGDGLTTCSAPSTICCNVCVEDDAGGCTNVRDVSCIAPDAGSACSDHSGGANAIPCSDPSACAADGHPGDVCCGILSGSVPDDAHGYLNAVACMPLADCKAHVSGAMQSYDLFCDPSAADPCGGANGAPGASCVAAQAASGFSRCE